MLDSIKLTDENKISRGGNASGILGVHISGQIDCAADKLSEVSRDDLCCIAAQNKRVRTSLISQWIAM